MYLLYSQSVWEALIVTPGLSFEVVYLKITQFRGKF